MSVNGCMTTVMMMMMLLLLKRIYVSHSTIESLNLNCSYSIFIELRSLITRHLCAKVVTDHNPRMWEGVYLGVRLPFTPD